MSRTPIQRLAVCVGLLASTTAFALPWDVDMADVQSRKAYSHEMKPLPEGVVAQDNVLTPAGFTPNYNRLTPEGMALQSPYETTPELLELGERMYGIYCQLCHGDGETMGPVAAPGRFPGVVPLSGAAGMLKLRPDGWVYLTIRNGGAIMPSYGWAMDDQELWSIVHYVRTLPASEYIDPNAPSDAEETP